jgi:hypothetical protein
MNKYTCPVCGYPELDEPPYDLLTGGPSFDICPCCGCEYGYDAPKPGRSQEDFLRFWIKQGAPWFSPDLKPSDWDLRKQLEEINIDFDEIAKQ